jgi:hypothetical protein
MTPEYQDDGSILFVDENGEKIVQLLPPFMEDAGHDYFDPSWGQGADRRYSLYWAYIRSQLLQWKLFGQIATTYYNWAGYSLHL